MNARSERLAIRLLAVLPLLLALSLRLAFSTYIDLPDHSKQALYVLDIVENGNWILPQLRSTLPIASPPLYAYIAAAAASLVDVRLEVAVLAPSMIASILLVLLIYQFALESWGSSVALISAWIFACSVATLELSTLLRPDAFATAFILASWFALMRATQLRTRRGALLFWAGISLSLLSGSVMGPVAVLASLLPLGVRREQRAALTRILRSGWSWLLLLPCSWILMSYIVGGSAYTTETLLPALLSSKLPTSSGLSTMTEIVPTLAWLFASLWPWTILAIAGSIWALGSTQTSLARQLTVPMSILGSTVALLIVSGGRAQELRLVVTTSIAWLAGLALAHFHLLPSLPWTPLGFRTLGSWARSSQQVFAASLFLVLTTAASLSGVHEAKAAASLVPEEFARQVRLRTQGRDRLRVLEGTEDSLFVLLRYNDPALTVAELEAYRQWAPDGGRPLIVASQVALADLSERWPGRFEVLLSDSDLPNPMGLVLLEVIPTRPRATPGEIPWVS